MRHQSEYDQHLEHSDPDDDWVGGELDVGEERPTTALSSDPGQRKWMLIGVGGCGLVTAIAVLLLTRDTPQAHATHEPEPPAIEQTVEPEVAPVEPVVAEPSTTEATESKATTKPTLAAASHVAAKRSKPAPKTAPPPPAPAASKPAPAPSKPAPTPSKPTPKSSAPASKPAKPSPEPAPALPSASEQTSAGPAGDLPDVEGWDEADAAAERDEPTEDPTPAPSEPPSVESEAEAEA